MAGLPMITGAIGCTLGGLLTDWLVRTDRQPALGPADHGLVGKGGGALLALRRRQHGRPDVGGGLDLAVGVHQRPGPGGPLGGEHRHAGGRFVGTVFGFMNMVAAIGGCAVAGAGRFHSAAGCRRSGRGGKFDPAAREAGLERDPIHVRGNAGRRGAVLAADRRRGVDGRRSRKTYRPASPVTRACGLFSLFFPIARNARPTSTDTPEGHPLGHGPPPGGRETLRPCAHPGVKGPHRFVCCFWEAQA